MIADDAADAPALPRLYSSFDWSNEKLWALDWPVETVPMREVDWHLRVPVWSTVPRERRFDLRPIDVLRSPDAHRWHFERIRAADTEWPVDMIWADGRYVILDGVHRLAKLWIAGARALSARRLTADMASLIASRDYHHD